MYPEDQLPSFLNGKHNLMPLSHFVNKSLWSSPHVFFEERKDEHGQLIFFFHFPFSCSTLPREVLLVNPEMTITGQKAEL